MKFMENTKINFMKFKSFGFGLSSMLAFGSIILLLMGKLEIILAKKNRLL